MTGFVSLVGAGPGDPDLLTLKAAAIGRGGSRSLRWIGLHRGFEVGGQGALLFRRQARAGRHGIQQEEIHALMIKEARRGRRVVRLKCGDPFVLGRGGEEALALAEAGIPFEVVPGVSAAVAAPALAGIPVTHRGATSGFLVVSGHAEAAYRPALASLAPNAATVVILMGLSARAPISGLLLERGWARETPAAILLGASTPSSWTWTGFLVDLGAVEIPNEVRDLPGCLCVGEVVSLAGRLASLISQEGAWRRSGTR